MAKIHDDIAQALSANATKIDTLGKAKVEGDSAFTDILATVQSQGSQLDGYLSGDNDNSTSTSSTVTVSTATASGITSVPVTSTASEPAAVGSTVEGPGIASGTTVAPGTTTTNLVLDTATTQGHDGGETLTITAPSA